MTKKEINQLVQLYFMHNPQNNKGIGFRVKANDIITSYATIQKLTYDEIKECIESSPMCTIPIWDQFSQYYYKKKKSKNNSSYKDSVEDSTDVNDWL